MGHIWVWELAWQKFIRQGIDFFPPFQQSFFCILQANTKLCYNFAIADYSFSQRYPLFPQQENCISKQLTKQNSHLFTTVSSPFSLHLNGFQETLDKCFSQWQGIFKHILKKQSIFIAQNQNYLIFTWWSQCLFHFALYHL